MILYVLLNVIQYASVLNVKFNVKRLLVLNAKSTVINHNVMFVVLKIYVKLKIVLNVKQYALQLTAVLLVLLQSQCAHQCVKRPNVIGNAENQPPVLNQNVNYNVLNLLVKLKPQLNVILNVHVVNVMLLTLLNL